MAPKNKTPSSASSSSEEEEQDPAVDEEEEEQSTDEESGEEEESEEEEEEHKTAPPAEKKTQKPLQTPQQKPHSSESDGSGSGSYSDADSGQSQQPPSPSTSDFHVKPNVPAAKSSTKRPSQETQQQAQQEKESRSKKKPKIVAEEEEKKSSSVVTTNPSSSKLWNDEDQIALLKGMIEFKGQKGSEPFDMSAFHDFIKGKLQVEVSKSQISDKFKRLKKKLLTALKSGEDPVFNKPHEYLIFELSKKIWANANNGVTENVNANGKAKKTSKSSGKVSTSKEDEKPVTVKEVGDFESKYPRLAKSFSMVELYGNCVDMLKKKMSSIPDEKAKVLEERWKKLEDEEHVLLAKRLELITEHVKLAVGTKIEDREEITCTFSFCWVFQFPSLRCSSILPCPVLCWWK